MSDRPAPYGSVVVPMFLLRTAPVATVATIAMGCDRLFHRGELPALDHFEGELDFSARGSFAKGVPEPAPVTVYVKDDKLRFDAPSPVQSAAGGASGSSGAATAGGGSFLFDSPRKRFFVLNAGQKQAIEFDMVEDAKPSAPRSDHAGGNEGAPVVTKTGRKSLVAGYACEDWEVVLPDQKKDTVCVATTPASFFRVPVPGGLPGARGWMNQVFDGQHVPLRLVAADKSGAETGRLELTKIERAAEDDSTFAVPEGYQTIDLSTLLQGKGPPNRGAPLAAPPTSAPFSDPQSLKLRARPSHS